MPEEKKRAPSAYMLEKQRGKQLRKAMEEAGTTVGIRIAQQVQGGVHLREVHYPCVVVWIDGGEEDTPENALVKAALSDRFNVHFSDLSRARVLTRGWVGRTAPVVVVSPGRLHPCVIVREVRQMAPWWDVVVVGPDPGELVRMVCGMAGAAAWLPPRGAIVVSTVWSLTRRHARLVGRRKEVRAVASPVAGAAVPGGGSAVGGAGRSTSSTGKAPTPRPPHA